MDWLKIIYATLIILIIFVFYKFIIYGIKKLRKKADLEASTYNGLKFLIRLIFLITILLILFNYIGIPAEYLVSISSVTGLILGFASKEVFTQIIAGLYIMISRPFNIHDLISVSGVEGIVTEIGMSYTTIQQFNGSIVKVPNEKMMNSRVKNYTFELDEDLKLRLKYNIDEEKRQEEEIFEEIVDKLSDLIIEEEITRYLFDIEVNLDQLPDDVIEKLNIVCRKYEQIYRFRPVFFPVEFGYRIKLRFRIYCINPSLIINNQANFMRDIVYAIYGGEE
ncbi:MAG: mechanosensitive ion channel domain-containing protein [Promethearchaeota archaeon]